MRAIAAGSCPARTSVFMPTRSASVSAFAAEAQLVRLSGGLCGAHRRDGGISATGGADQQGCDEGCDRGQRLIALLFDAAREVPLAQVCKFVGHDR